MADSRGHSAGYMNFFGPRENPDEDGWSQLIEKARREKDDLWERLKRESIREEPTVEKDVWWEERLRREAIGAEPVVFIGAGSFPEERARARENAKFVSQINARGMAASRYISGYRSLFGPRENEKQQPDEEIWSQLREEARREKDGLWERLKRESIGKEPMVEKDVWLERLRREAAIRPEPVVFIGNVGSYNPEERARENEIIARGMAASRVYSFFGPREDEKQQPDEEIWSQIREKARREKDGLWERLKRESIMVFKGNVGSYPPQLDGYTDPEERARDYAKYVSQINASGGFDVDSFPKFQGFLDMITPVKDEDLKSLANVAAIAIENFNSNHQGANYQVDEVVKATQRFCQGMVYNITFTAKEEGGAKSITFIASVYCAIPSRHREVQFCDVKTPEHESEAKKLLNHIVI